MMKRREAIQKMGISAFGIISASAFVEVLQSCQGSDEKGNGFLRLLNPQQEALVDEIADIIIPATESPGARAAEIGKFIDLMLADCYYESDQTSFIEGLTRIEQFTTAKFNKPFSTIGLDNQISVIKSEAKPAESGQPTRFFQLMKELTLLGYFTSEVGATQALSYSPVPGRYDGCITIDENQKLWTI